MKTFLERWRDIEGYEGLYQVSNFGNVRSLKYGKTRVLKPAKDKDGYLNVNLWKDGKAKHYYVHRLVATAFVYNPYNLPEVNHIDENKENNVVSNLEWCTHAYNNNYGTRTERQAEALRGVYNNPKRSKKVLQLTLDGKIVREWASVNECGRNGFSIGNVSQCCRNEYCSQGNVYKGYRWMYAEDYYKNIARKAS